MRTPSDPQAQPGACPATDTTPIAATAATAGAQSEPVSTLTGLAQHLAIAHAQHTQRQTGRHHARLLDRLPILAMDLRAAYQAVLRMSTDNRALSYPAEWLLDNFYVVEQALHLILEDLPETFYRQLPVLAGEGPASGPPRVYTLAHAFVAHEQCEVEVSQLQDFVRAYQQTQPLTMGEVWALPLMVRLHLLEHLAQGVRAVLQRETDGAMSQHPGLDDHDHVSAAIPSLRRLDSTDWQAYFEAVSLVDQTLRQDPAQVYSEMDFPSRDAYRKVIEELAAGSTASELAIAQQALALAQRSDTPRSDSTAAPLFGIRRYHVGYYLLGNGRQQLEQTIAYRASGTVRWRRWAMARPTLVYLGGMSLVTVLLLAGVGAYTARVLPADHLFVGILGALLLTLVPAHTAAIATVNWLLTHTLPTRVLPKLEFATGIPASCRTMVVIPCLISQSNDLDMLFRQLELHFLRNADPELTFALLSDFADAATPTRPEDQSLLAYAQVRWAALNKAYAHQPFYFFHRQRLWNPREHVWMGWERKRGKLHELNRLLRGAQDTSYSTCLGPQERLATIRYVLTLDADTVLPRDAARRLVGTLAHPLNQAAFAVDALAGQQQAAAPVIDGYTIVQPRTAVQPVAANQSLFTRVFAGDSGFDLYTLAVSDVYQDLFGAGIYVGKGLYDVDAFERSLQGCIPENTLLSHDLCEGIHGRVALVSDVVLYEDYPPHYLINVRRSHRWVRGDWQLLPWLLGRGTQLLPSPCPLLCRWWEKGGMGAKAAKADTTMPQRRRLGFIDHWKMLDNLRRSLLPPALLLLFIAGWTVLPGAPLVWTMLGLLVTAQPLLIDTLAGLARGTLLAWRRRTHQALTSSTLRVEHTPWPMPLRQLRNGAIRALLFLAFLPYEALLMLDAIATTLVRLCLTRRRLLQWTTAARTVRLFGDEVSAATTWREMGPSLLLVAVLALVVSMVRPPALVVAAPFLLTWLFASQIAYVISRPRPSQVYTPSDEETQCLRTLARRTWLFYEQFVGPDDHWLPPDHFQEVPRGVVAQRTSPTNIGLYMLSVLAAHDLGYLTASDYVLRLRFTFETLARLDVRRDRDEKRRNAFRQGFDVDLRHERQRPSSP